MIDYKKIYEIKKAEKLLEKYGILDSKQKQNNDNEIIKEKEKKKGK